MEICARCPIVLKSDDGLIAPKVVAVIWRRPLPGWTKINTDGAYLGSTGQAACSAVFRDCTGSVIKAFCCYLGTESSVLETEVTGMILAIDMAYQLGLRRVWLETDSTQTVEIVRDLIEHHLPELSYPTEVVCRAVMQLRSMEIMVSHIYREGNTVADKLANVATRTRQEFASWDHAPDFILNEVQKDAHGYIYYRVKK